MTLCFVCLKYDPYVWDLLKRLGDDHCVRIKENHSATLMCTKVQDAQAGFLRAELAPAKENQPRLTGVLTFPSHLAAWITEIGSSDPMGFVAALDWPFPPNRT